MFNPQQQFPVTWPAESVVARAYLDQLARDGALDPQSIIDLSHALDRADESLGAGTRDRGLAKALERHAERLGEDGGGTISARRRAGLAETLDGIAARLR